MKILHNARIYTLEKARPLASVIALDHGEIVAVGGEELLREFEGAPREDLGGRVVLPGLSDAHLHLKHYALSLRQIDCETDTLAECLRRVRRDGVAVRARQVDPGTRLEPERVGGMALGRRP